jgi:hypothetical protein
MTSNGWRGGRWTRALGNGLLLLGVAMVAGLSQVAAAECEVRDFHILVDGKKRGDYRMAIGKQDDGLIIMTGKAHVSVSYLVYSYTYTYDGKEVWKNGRLQSFSSSTDDNGKRFAVSAEAEDHGLRVKVNGQGRHTRGDVWLTSYWQLPPARFHNGAIHLIDADTGKDIRAHLHYLGVDRMVVAGQHVNCSHYRVTGGPSPVDLWFDGSKRLVRQDYMDDGHRTVLVLTSVRR